MCAEDSRRRPAGAGFESATVQVIKSIRQRNLFNKWLTLYSGGKVAPQFGDFHPDIPEQDRETIVDFTITYENDEPCVTIESYGSRMASAYGSTGKGQRLVDYLGAELAPYILPPYLECIRRELPIYSVSRVDDANKRSVDVERLLLPLRKGGRVGHIVVSFEIISEEGSFELRNLMRKNLPKPILRAIIDQSLTYEPPPRIAPNDRIVFD